MNNSFEASHFTTEVAKAFEKAGFKEREYNGQKGRFVAKDVPVQDWVKAYGMSEDDDAWGEDCIVTIEVIPAEADHDIQFCIHDLDVEWYERYEFAAEPKKWLKVAAAAGVEGLEDLIQASQRKNEVGFKK